MAELVEQRSSDDLLYRPFSSTSIEDPCGFTRVLGASPAAACPLPFPPLDKATATSEDHSPALLVLCADLRGAFWTALLSCDRASRHHSFHVSGAALVRVAYMASRIASHARSHPNKNSQIPCCIREHRFWNDGPRGSA